MAGSLADNARVYKKFNYVPPTPPSSLIDCTTFTIDFADRKFIHVGLDPERDFNVAIQIITASRHVRISPDFLKRIFSLMGNILSAILDTPNKTRGVIFLKDDTLLLTKMVYRGENQLVIESQTEVGCRVLLNRKDLLTLQDLEVCISESVLRKSTIIRSIAMRDITIISEYLDKERTRGNLSMILNDVKQAIDRCNIKSTAEPNFISQIKLFAAQQIADRWYGQDEVDSPKLFDISPPQPFSPPPMPQEDSQTSEVSWVSASTTARDFYNNLQF